MGQVLRSIANVCANALSTALYLATKASHPGWLAGRLAAQIYYRAKSNSTPVLYSTMSSIPSFALTRIQLQGPQASAVVI